jgi:hypothetical protein
MDRNGWPLSHEQELSMSGWDLIRNDCIRITAIQCVVRRFDTDDELSYDHKLNLRNASTITLADDLPVNTGDDCVDDLVDNSYAISSSNNPNALPGQLMHRLPSTLTTASSFASNTSFNMASSVGYAHNCACTFETTNDETFVSSSGMQAAHKPILISYVRKEAEQHARRLKSKLIKLGLEVFLDVDEITVGNDWQDSLNNAVANCEIFVPLITPNYGLTLWTNREIKFADMKKKIIVPINFLSTWPPECLAIQFATTQFLPWKTMEEIDREYEIEGERAFDTRVWDDRFVVRTAQQISSLVKKKSLARRLLSNEYDSNETTLSLADANESNDENSNDKDFDTLESELCDDGLKALVSPSSSINVNRPITATTVDLSAYSAVDSVPVTESSSDLQSCTSVTNTKSLNERLTYAESVASNLRYPNRARSNGSCHSSNASLSTLNSSIANISNQATEFSQSLLSVARQEPIERIERKASVASEPNSPYVKAAAVLSPDDDSLHVPLRRTQQAERLLVVISAHPQQKNEVSELRRHLLEHYQVWSSTDMCVEDCSLEPPVESTDAETATANIEGNFAGGSDEPDNLISRNMFMQRSDSFVAARRRPSRLELNTTTTWSTGSASESLSPNMLKKVTTPLTTSTLNDQTLQEHLETATEFVIPQRDLKFVKHNPRSPHSLEIPCDSLLQMELETSATIDLNTHTQSSYCKKLPLSSLPSVSPHHNPLQRCTPTGSASIALTECTRNRQSWYGCTSSGEHISSLAPNEIDKVNVFKEKVNQARIVIILLSEAYCQSRTCKRQAFYCDFRKQVLPIQLEAIVGVPHWVSKLMYNPDLIPCPSAGHGADARFFNDACAKLCGIIRCDERANAHALDEHTRCLAGLLERSLALRERPQVFVYVAGSAKIKRCGNRSLCVKVGQALAAHDHLVLVTGGNCGVAETIAFSFYRERMRLAKRQETTLKDGAKDVPIEPNIGADPSRTFVINRPLDLDDGVEPDDERLRELRDPIEPLHVLHVLPRSDSSERGKKYARESDGSFRAPSFGRCVRVGDSFQERDSLVARVFRFCVLIEGGAGSAKLAQEFAYNENFVLPVCSTGGAAAGKFIAQEECGHDITDLPAGVSGQDWTRLKTRGQNAQLGHVLARIVSQLTEYRAAKRCRMIADVQKACTEHLRQEVNGGERQKRNGPTFKCDGKDGRESERDDEPQSIVSARSKEPYVESEDCNSSTRPTRDRNSIS